MKISLAQLQLVNTDPLKLRERWKVESRAVGWRFDDWLVPEVEGLIDASVAGVSLRAPARRLGAARAYHGVGIGETMLDFRAFFTSVDRPCDEGALRALVEGWVAENERVEPFVSCTDVYTGLATVSHFERLIHELAWGSRENREAVTLATLHLEREQGRGAFPWIMSVQIGLAFEVELAPVNAVGTMHRANIHVILPRLEEGYSALMRFVARLETLKIQDNGRIRVDFRDMTETPLRIQSTA